MKTKKPTYEELEQEINKLRKMQETNVHTNDPINFHHAGMNVVNDAINTAADIQEMMSNVMKAVLDLFDTDRSWLLFPCDPDSKTWSVPMECTKPGYEGVHAMGEEIPMNPKDAEAFKRMQNSYEVVTYDYSQNPKETSERFSILTEMFMSLHPKTGEKWLFGVHQCTYSRVWTDEEKKLFKEIGHRIGDALNSFLSLNNLKESEKKFRTITETSPLAIYMSTGIEQKTEYINPTFVKLFGYALEDVPTVADWWPIAYPDEEYRNKLVTEWQEKVEHSILTKSETEPMEAVVTCKDGSEKSIIWGYISTGIQNWAFGLDISRQKEIETELKNLNFFLKNVTDNVQDGIWVTDKNDVIFYANKGMEEIAGIPKDKILGNNVLKDFPKETTVQFNVFYKKAKKELIPTWYEVIVKTPAGAPTWQNGWLVPILKNGNFDGIICTIRNITERKITENLLKDSEENFRGIYEQSPIAIEIFDKKGKLIDVNQKALQMFGVDDKKYVLGFDLWADPNLSDKKMNLLKSGQPIYISTEFDFEIVKETQLYPTSRSGIIYMDMYAIPLLRDKVITGYLLHILEVTDRKKAEEALIESEERLKLALETNNTGAWDLNLIDHTSKRTLLHDQIFGYENLLSKWTFEMFLEHVIPEDRSFVDRRFREAVASVSDWKFECRIRRPDGQVRWISAIGRHIADSDGKPLHLSGIVQDITERKLSEEALAESEKRLNEAQRMASIGHWVQEVQSGKLIWSDETFRIFDIDKEFSGELYEVFISLIHPDDKEAVVKAFSDSLNTKKPYEITHKIVLSDGREKYVHERCETEYDESGNPVKSIGTVQDITERKKTEMELLEIYEKLEKLVDERTKEIEDKNRLLERTNKLFVGRELRMKELKQQINELEKRLI